MAKKIHRRGTYFSLRASRSLRFSKPFRKIYYSASQIYNNFVMEQMQQSKLITESYKKLTRFSII
ncbi:MAG: hypothetical protein ACT6FC_06535, partial [Methanosarcinaceae archaeon]